MREGEKNLLPPIFSHPPKKSSTSSFDLFWRGKKCQMKKKERDEKEKGKKGGGLGNLAELGKALAYSSVEMSKALLVTLAGIK